jgi:hypothetical protein
MRGRPEKGVYLTSPNIKIDPATDDSTFVPDGGALNRHEPG